MVGRPAIYASSLRPCPNLRSRGAQGRILLARTPPVCAHVLHFGLTVRCRFAAFPLHFTTNAEWNGVRLEGRPLRKVLSRRSEAEREECASEVLSALPIAPNKLAWRMERAMDDLHPPKKGFGGPPCLGYPPWCNLVTAWHGFNHEEPGRLVVGASPHGGHGHVDDDRPYLVPSA